MNALMEYLFELDLLNDPFLYSFYISLFFSYALSQVWSAFIQDASSLCNNEWKVEQAHIQQKESLQPSEQVLNDIRVWIYKTIRRQESSPDDDQLSVFIS